MKVGIWCAVSSRAQAEDARASLPEQERLGRAWADSHGFTVTSVMCVPGHSRAFYSLPELVTAAEGKGIHAFTELMGVLDNPSISALWVRDGDRFARTQALFSYIVERLIASNVQIYSNADGWINAANYRMWISMVGYRSAADIDTLKARRAMGFKARAKQGLPTSTRVPFTHLLINEDGVRKLIPNPAHSDLLQLAGQLVAEGVGWAYIERELKARYGVVRHDGQQYTSRMFHKLMHNPLTWGHTCIGRTYSQNTQQHAPHGMWQVEPGHPIPEQVQVIHYHVTEPLYTGELADRIKERLRQDDIRRGGAASHGRHRYTSLLYCAECGYSLIYQQGKRITCATRWNLSDVRTECSQHARIPERVFDAFFARLLTDYVTSAPEDLFTADERPDDERTAVTVLQQRISGLDAQLRGMIRLQSTANAEAVAVYQEEIEKASTELKRLKTVLEREQSQTRNRDARVAQITATQARIRELTLERFWARSDAEINEDLLTMMGDNVLLVAGGQVVDVDTRPVRSRPGIQSFTKKETSE